MTAEYPKGWKRNLEKFNNLFFGTTRNAKACVILNPEVLNFQKDEANGIFSASAKQPIEIENRALGYRVKFHLRNFRLAGEYQLRCEGHTEYKPLKPDNKKEPQKWEKRRLSAYNGSPRHFYSALLAGRLVEEGFEINHVYRMGKVEKGLPIYREDLLSEWWKPYERALSFPDFPRIIYLDEAASPEYLQISKHQIQHPSWSFSRRRENVVDDDPRDYRQISCIQVDQSIPVILNEWGNVTNSHSITTYGYWAWERFAEELPADYQPPK